MNPAKASSVEEETTTTTEPTASSKVGPETVGASQSDHSQRSLGDFDDQQELNLWVENFVRKNPCPEVTASGLNPNSPEFLPAPAAMDVTVVAVPVAVPVPVIAVPVASVVQPAHLQVAVPIGWPGGSLLQITAPCGQQVQVPVPPGLHAGEVFIAQLVPLSVPALVTPCDVQPSRGHHQNQKGPRQQQDRSQKAPAKQSGNKVRQAVLKGNAASAKERQDENGRHNGAKSPKEIPEASEEDWIERIKKRWDGVKNLESKEFYKLNQDISRSHRPPMPNPEDRTLSKRDWEQVIAECRTAWRLIHNVRKLVKEQSCQEWHAVEAWQKAEAEGKRRRKGQTQEESAAEAEDYDRAVQILGVQKLIEIFQTIGEQDAVNALTKAKGNVELAAQILLGR